MPPSACVFESRVAHSRICQIPMRPALLTLAATLAVAAPLRGADAANQPSPDKRGVATSTGAESRDQIESPVLPSPLYGGIEYLLWWVKPAPLSVPLVSTGPISTT